MAVVAVVLEAVVAGAAPVVAAALVVVVALVVDDAPPVFTGVLVAATEVVEAVGVVAPVAALLAGVPTPSAWKAAIMALTSVFSRKRGRSSSS